MSRIGLRGGGGGGSGATKTSTNQRYQLPSIASMIRLALIALSIKHQLLLDERLQTVLSRPMGLIYNRDGKFIYRPPRLSQGHIIVIDDRQKGKSSSSSSSSSSAAAAAAAAALTDSGGKQSASETQAHQIFPQLQLITPSGSIIQLPEPGAGAGQQQSAASTGTARLATPTGSPFPAAGSTGFQLIDLNDLRAAGQGLRPAGSIARAAHHQSMAAATAGAGLQTMGSAVRLIPLIQFYPAPAAAAAAAAVGPPMNPLSATVSQQILARPSRYLSPLPPSAQLYMGPHYSNAEAPPAYGFGPESWQRAAAQQHPQLHRDLQSAAQAHHQQQQQQQAQQAFDGHYEGAQERLESLYASHLTGGGSQDYETDPTGFGEHQNPFGSSSSPSSAYSNHQTSEATFVGDIMPPPSSSDMSSIERQSRSSASSMMPAGRYNGPESDIIMLPQHQQHRHSGELGGASSRSRSASRLSMTDMMSGSGGQEQGAMDEPGSMSEEFRSAYLPSSGAGSGGGRISSTSPSGRAPSSTSSPSMDDDGLLQGAGGSRHAEPTSHLKVLPPSPPTSSDNVIDFRGVPAALTGSKQPHSQTGGKRNSHGRSRSNSSLYQSQQQQHKDHKGGPSMMMAMRPGSLIRGDTSAAHDGPSGAGQSGSRADHEDDLTNPDSRGAQYWKQFRDQFDVLH